MKHTKMKSVIDLHVSSPVPVYFLMHNLIKMGFEVDLVVGISRQKVYSNCGHLIADTLQSLMYNNMEWDEINDDYFEGKVANYLHSKKIAGGGE
tara:strand:- start:176 stop:457 length:282 start_codon:yes stop_codon:yes gene_type:complete